MRYVYILATLFLPASSVAQQFHVKHYSMEHGLSHSSVYRIFQDKRGFLWFCTDLGVCSFDGRSFHTLAGDSLLGNAILSMSEDKQGNKLISTIKEGLLLMSDTAITAYPFFGNSPKYLLFAAEHKNLVWLAGREDGDFLYRVKNKTVEPYNLKDSAGRNAAVHKIIQYQDGLLLASAAGIYQIRDSVPEPFLAGLVRGNVEDVRRAKDGTYWVAMTEKLLGIRDNKIIYSYALKPGQKIKSLLCDKFGHIWLGLHKDGILLLDGTMKDVTTMLDMNTSLVNDLFEDSEGNIWFATYNSGVYKLSSTDLLEYPLREHGHNLYCRSLERMDKDRFIVSTLGRVYIWEQDTLKPFACRNLQPDEYIYTSKVHNDKLFVGTSRGLLIKDLRTKDGAETRPDIDRFGALALCFDHKGHTWIGGFSHLYFLGEDQRVGIDSSHALLRNKRYQAIIEDSKQNIWFGTNKGLLCYDGKHYFEFGLPGEKNKRSVFALLEDSHRRIWLATKGGLGCISNGKLRFFTTEDGLTQNKCNALAEDHNNTLWVATANGLSYVDLNTLEIRPYSLAIYPEEIMSLYCNENNRLFAGTPNGLASFSTLRELPDRSPPRVYITTVRTGASELKMPGRIELPYYDNKLRIEFIGLSFQNVNTVEYRYTLKGLNRSWTYTRDNSIELPSLPSGSYSFVLEARRNQGSWSSSVAIPIFVSTPFWKSVPFMICMSLALVLLIFLLTRQQTRRLEHKKRRELARHNKELVLLNKIAHLKQQALVALINPHFIFNCMNSIQHYLNRNDLQKTNNYLADFANLIRLTIEHAQDGFIVMEEELRRIRLYLSLEQLRFGEKLSYEIDVDGALNASRIRIPNMILQPYLENAIWHGIMPDKKKQGKILLSFKKINEQEMLISVYDNGIGINQGKAKRKKTQQSPIGMPLTEERLSLLRKLSGQSYQVLIHDLSNEGGGTCVEITIPLQEQEPGDLQTGEETIS